MLEVLKNLDTDTFLFLNSMHSEFMDAMMFRITNKLFWIPFYLFLIFLCIKDYKKESIWIILGAIILVSISDLLVSGLMKPYFERLRPSRDPSLDGLVHIVNGYRGGSFSFASGHAATSFCLVTFMWRIMRNIRPWIWIIFLWSILFSYSRIYLGVHYPGDIIVGAIIGSLIGYSGHLTYGWFYGIRNMEGAD